MKTLEYRTFLEDDMMHNVNVAKRILLAVLAEKGLLKQEYAERFDREWFFVMKRPSWISSAWNKLMGRAEEEQMVLVRTVNLHPDKPGIMPEPVDPTEDVITKK